MFRCATGKEACNMKNAVTYENGEIYQHFGHSKKFKIYDIDGGQIKDSHIADNEGNSHGALAGFLKSKDVDTLICGGIGAGAQLALAEADIALYGCVSCDPDQAVSKLLEDRLQYNPDIACSPHHEVGHKCGHHDK